MKTTTDTSRESLRAKLSERITFLICSLLLTCAVDAQAQTATGTLKNTSYSMSVGDVNGDGREDVLMKAVPRTVAIPLDDDLTIPLVIPPKVPSFALMSDAYWGYVLVPNPDPQLMQMNWSSAGTGALQFGATGQHADTVRIAGAGGEFVVALNDVTKQLALVQLPGVSKAAGTVTYIHTDGLGSPVARTNAAGQMVSRTLYEPYGYVAAGATPTIGFTGHVNDADTGLTYMQQRYYDPVAGRFLSIDPVVTNANTGSSFNRYAYAINNPFKFIDPDGRKEERREITPEDRRRAREEARKIYEEKRITTQRCAEQTCTNSENAVAALQGIWSVFTGAGNSIRFVARGIGVLGPEEKKKWNEESKRVDDFVSRYRNDPAFKREVDQGARDVAGKVLTENSNGAGKAYISARAATGIITGLGPAAVIGDTVRAVEQGNGMAESLISGGILGE